MEITARTHVVDTEDARLFVTDRGDGPPLLLLHGLTGTHDDFRHIPGLDALARSHRVIAPDARMHGRSTGAPDSFTFRRCGLDVLAILDALRLDRVSAIGLSLGGNTLLHAATIAPSRFETLALVSATPRFPEATRALFRLAASAPRTPERRAELLAMHPRGDAQIDALAELPRRFADDGTDMAFTKGSLAAITARTLIVAGDRDPLYPIELPVELFRSIANASLWVVPGGGHTPVFADRAASFAEEATRFFAP